MSGRPRSSTTSSGRLAMTSAMPTVKPSTSGHDTYASSRPSRSIVATCARTTASATAKGETVGTGSSDGIGVGALFAWRAARGGGDANDQALAYFLPGIIYNLGYSVVMVFTILIRWPVVGFMVGGVTGEHHLLRRVLHQPGLPDGPQVLESAGQLDRRQVGPRLVRPQPAPHRRPRSPGYGWSRPTSSQTCG